MKNFIKIIRNMIVMIMLFVFIYCFFYFQFIGGSKKEIFSYKLIDVTCRASIRTANGGNGGDVCLFKGIRNEKEISGLVIGSCEQSSKHKLFQTKAYIYGSDKYVLFCE
ncbi:hypothetical protein [Aliivibrio fischeri]|uniref:hypothetical protein n=1 Tax=Aliivibrio fischeri TaxID=668 RepID=UPI00080E83EB|nr:hypothetical protein [Aliivibrio fischeri]OCH08326.1 hypothetical protein A6E11_12540 [Aliivibrio fischeri]OCH27807.1 hypothetical protein A6E13_08650 [Aliivibrio fischeri]OCH59382.1 hypothetical protein A6D98_13475 [Aliivibrio fischeri]